MPLGMADKSALKRKKSWHDAAAARLDALCAVHGIAGMKREPHMPDAMTRRAQPIDIERVSVVWVMFFCGCAAKTARFWSQMSARLIDVGFRAHSRFKECSR